MKYTGVTGTVDFNANGDPKKAVYFVLKVVSDDPQRWGENWELKRVIIAAPGPKA